MLEAVGHPTVVNPGRGLGKEATARGWPVLTFSRPVPLRDRIPAPSGAAVATTFAVGFSALFAGALTYSLLRRFAP
jgi:hypothetical protein